MKILTNENASSALLIAVTIIFTIFDIYKDFVEGSSIYHLGIELIVIVFLISTIIVFLRNLLRDKAELVSTLSGTRKDLTFWKKKSSKLINGLSQEIDQQFTDWSLSKSEKEIGILLIKGFSIKEISTLRGTAEKTVKVQTSAIYRKSNLNNRSELAAFFLEDLLLPQEMDSSNKDNGTL